MKQTFKINRLPMLAYSNQKPFIFAMVKHGSRRKIGTFLIDPDAKETMIDVDALWGFGLHVSASKDENGNVSKVVNITTSLTLSIEDTKGGIASHYITHPKASQVCEEVQFSGIIGQDFLKNYSVTFDFSNDLMILEPLQESV